ncbi:hypothetical protein OG21DRAFT_1527525 [Imleria badia]|nr:hypothetical protein OG21DRAFT_1527525 [Imleria badia]
MTQAVSGWLWLLLPWEGALLSGFLHFVTTAGLKYHLSLFHFFTITGTKHDSISCFIPAASPKCTSSPTSSQPVDPPVAVVGPTTHGTKLWQIQFYKPAVQEILDHAKEFSHCDAASMNTFPLRTQFNTLAIEYMEEAVRERRSRSLSVSNGWWLHYSNEICRLFWEDLRSWHSVLRKKACIYITQCYKWDTDNHHQVNSDIVKELLGGNGAFLRNGIDEVEHMNNLAHPALTGLIIDFLYTSASSLSKLFPEVFAVEVPRVTVGCHCSHSGNVHLQQS